MITDLEMDLLMIYQLSIQLLLNLALILAARYLLKRGGFRKNWKLRYFYLVGNQLRYFPNHNVSLALFIGLLSMQPWNRAQPQNV